MSATDNHSNTQALYSVTDSESESIQYNNVSGLCVRLTFHGFKMGQALKKQATLNRDKALSSQNHDSQSTKNKYRTVTAAGVAPPEPLQLC